MFAIQTDTLDLLVRHMNELISNGTEPELPAEFVDAPDIVALHNRILELRLIISDFAKGNLSHTIAMRGFVAGGLKALQSNLRHLTWQAQQIERGDFRQQVHFLGDFSVAFNSMVSQLDNTVKALRQKEETLTELTESLKKEVELRTAAAQALKLSEAKFKYLAEHDSLTGINNRRSFCNLAISTIQSAHLNNAPCCLLLLDVDRFKTFNDTYGHPEGDLALKHIVQVSKTMLRQTDMMGRYGGEEFIFILSNTAFKQGEIVAERIGRAIQASPVTLSDGQSVHITASIGMAHIPPEWYHPQYANALFQYYVSCADAALYEAKDKGRNQVVFVMPEEPVLENLNEN